jgi:DNA-directed RNA polymerase specialized sigma24 family protein
MRNTVPGQDQEDRSMDREEDAPGSVSRWIEGLKEGDSRAAGPLWDRFHRRIVGLARARLGNAGGFGADEEDAALSAFLDLFEGAPRGKFPQLEDRDDFWSLLAVITARKVSDIKKRQMRDKRGGHRTLGTSDLDDGGPAALEQVAGPGPTPELSMIMAEECRLRLDALEEPFRQVALLRLDGRSNEQIALEMGCTTRTVIRRINSIRDAWRRDVE